MTTRSIKRANRLSFDRKGRVKVPGWCSIFDEQADHYVIYGGRGSSKSINTGLRLLHYARVNKNSFIVCAREVQKSIADSNHRLLARLIDELGWGRFFNVQRDAIIGVNGSRFAFKGLSESFKTALGIRSMEGIDILWVEEADTITQKTLDLVLPTMREEGSFIIWTFNPQQPDDPVYQMFVANKHPDAAVRQVNYKDNPFFTKRQERERARHEQEKPHTYAHIWLGETLTAVEGAMWTYQDIKFIEPKKAPEAYDQVWVSIDPATMTDKNADYTGISVVGSVGNSAFVLHSEHRKERTKQYGPYALGLLARYEANGFLVEKNGPGIAAIERLEDLAPKRYNRTHSSYIKEVGSS